MKAIPIFLNNQECTKTLNVLFKNRLRTQNRIGNNSGGMYFSPKLLSAILTNYDKQLSQHSTFNKWLERCLNSVYFELFDGGIVPLAEVDSVHLMSVQPKNNVPTHSGNFTPPIVLSQFQIPVPLTFQSSKPMYEVYIDYTRNNVSRKNQKVYVGDEDNVIYGIEDLTLDHVVPIRRVLELYQQQLIYLSKIDALIRVNGKSSNKILCKQINYNDTNALDGLRNELSLVTRAVQGIRVRAKRLNK